MGCSPPSSSSSEPLSLSGLARFEVGCFPFDLPDTLRSRFGILGVAATCCAAGATDGVTVLGCGDVREW